MFVLLCCICGCLNRINIIILTRLNYGRQKEVKKRERKAKKKSMSQLELSSAAHIDWLQRRDINDACAAAIF